MIAYDASRDSYNACDVVVMSVRVRVHTYIYSLASSVGLILVPVNFVLCEDSTFIHYRLLRCVPCATRRCGSAPCYWFGCVLSTVTTTTTTHYLIQI